MNRLYLRLGIAALGIGVTTALAVAQEHAAPAAQERTAPTTNAQVYFIAPLDGATLHGAVEVRFGLKGMGIAPAGVKFDGTGHHHLLIDTDSSELKMDAAIPASDKIVHFGKGQTETVLNLGRGKHTLELVFADYLHRSFDPPVHSKKITITVN